MSFLSRLFNPIMSTSKYENMLAAMENNCKKLNEILNSASYKRFTELKTIVETGKQSKEESVELKSLKHNEDIKILPKLQKKCNKYFEQTERWQSTLVDDFDSSLGANWITKPLPVEKGIVKPYSQENELQLTTTGGNVDVVGSALRITTRRESANGLRWNATHGFVPAKFEYTSGIASTATKYAQLHGKIEAKIKLPKVSGMFSSFWLGCSKNMPLLNVLSVNNGKYQVGVISDGQKYSKKLSLSEGFYIVAVEWNQNGITWFVNGKKVFDAPVRLSDEMYLAFSSGVLSELSSSALPATLDVDWVKCYKQK